MRRFPAMCGSCGKSFKDIWAQKLHAEDCLARESGPVEEFEADTLV